MFINLREEIVKVQDMNNSAGEFDTERKELLEDIWEGLYNGFAPLFRSLDDWGIYYPDYLYDDEQAGLETQARIEYNNIAWTLKKLYEVLEYYVDDKTLRIEENIVNISGTWDTSNGAKYKETVFPFNWLDYDENDFVEMVLEKHNLAQEEWAISEEARSK